MNDTSECTSQTPADPKHSSQDAQANQSRSSFETVNNVVSHNVQKEVAHKFEDTNREIKTEPANRSLLHSSAPKLKHIQTEISDFGISAKSAEGSTPDSRVLNDDSSALDSNYIGNTATTSLKTVHKVQPSLSVRGNGTANSVTLDDLSKSEIAFFLS